MSRSASVATQRHRLRMQGVVGRFRQSGISGLLLNQPANITYLTGYPARDSFLLLGRRGAVYFTDSRYTAEARAALPSAIRVEQIDARTTLEAALRRSCGSLGIDRLGFEERWMAAFELRRLRERVGRIPELVPALDLVEHLRRIKDTHEIRLIRTALAITAQVYADARRILKPGLTELEAVGELERSIRRRGADGPSFDIIVASGPNASYPHHLSSRRKMRSGEPVLLDMGVLYQGYRTDLTRVFFLGTITALVRKVYDTVRAAQEKAIARIGPGLAMADADAAARSYISECGYAGAFGHNLGHGVGLQTHELPSLSGKSGARFEPGMVVTVEPGIYLAGRFGVRIEDMVLVTHNKAEVLSGAIDK